jgi:hypothetical protein
MNAQALRGDRGGRRSGKERRQFVYDGHIPERRSGVDRRCGLDRRSGEDRRVRLKDADAVIGVAVERRSQGDRRRISPPYDADENTDEPGTRVIGCPIVEPVPPIR